MTVADSTTIARDLVKPPWAWIRVTPAGKIAGNRRGHYSHTTGRHFDPDGHDWVVSYAHTYLYSPREQHAKFIVAADN
jgi:hypothetical protein